MEEIELRVWLDRDEIDLVSENYMESVLRNSGVSIAFITKEYLDEVAKVRSNVIEELQYAARFKETKSISVVLDPDYLDPKSRSSADFGFEKIFQ